MIEVAARNIWNYYAEGNWIVITTNGVVRYDGKAVMGRGIALQAARRVPTLQTELGDLLTYKGNKVHIFPESKLITFPTKHHYKYKSSLDLIESSARQLAELASTEEGLLDSESIYMTRPGCGNGGLDWEEVKPILEPILNDIFKVVNYYG